MNYWKVLRWTGALMFVVIVLVAGWMSDRQSSADPDDSGGRAAPVIVR